MITDERTRIYNPNNVPTPAYQLRYAWTGWFVDRPDPQRVAEVLKGNELLTSWEDDGLRLLEHRMHDLRIQLLFSATPRVSPVTLSARAKGRLQYAMRCSGHPVRFSRKLSVRTIGDNKRAVSTLSVLPDHLHAALRGDINQSPEQIALTFMNDLADATGGDEIWQYGYYVGTFSEYDMDAIRRARSAV